MRKILKKITTSLLLLLLFTFTGCFRGIVWGNGNRVTQERNINSFRGVRADFIGDIYIKQGTDHYVTITGDSNLLELIVMEVKNDQLIIDSTKNYTTKKGIDLEITVPDLDTVRVNGVCDIEMVDFETKQLKLVTAGVGSIKASGRVEVLTAEVHGVGDLELKDLIGDDVTALVDGVGSIDVYANKTLDLRVNGVGDINYYGDAVLTFMEDDGVGSIRKK